MTDESGWQQIFQDELENALHARKMGNEGRARVCARRAAGIIVGEFLQRNQHPDPGANAYYRLKVFVTLDKVPVQYLEIAQHFLLKVDKEFKLPPEIDLIDDTLRLKQILE